MAEASAGVADDQPLMNIGRPLASGRASRLVEIMASLKEAEEQELTDEPATRGDA